MQSVFWRGTGKEDHVFDVAVLRNSRVKANIAGDLEIGRGLRKCLFHVADFRTFGSFLHLLAHFDHFRPPFFLFSLFFNFVTRYTRTEDATLYLSSSEIGFKV
jgi:hypothetical protein